MRSNRIGLLFVAPFLLPFLIFVVYPLLRSVWFSLHKWDLLGTEKAFVGVGNYRLLAADPFFWSALRNTLLFTFMAVPALVITGLALALVLERPLRLYAGLRAVFFASSVFSVSVVTLIWQVVLDPRRGLLAKAVEVDVLSNRWLAMPAIVVTTVWWGVGFPMVLFLAGLQQIPRAVYEAAQLDHASRWAVLRRITLPALARTTLLVVVMEFIMQFQIFGQVLLLTGGGPSSSTRVLVMYLYESAFRDWQLGYASAVANLLFIAMAVASFFQLRLGAPREAT
ncbi:MAG: sugar ABC transporter permease [Deltaproteobacteria bacterium]|nr:sugar ABC transporter permease [Deltaproteobacteria bacterium]